MCRITFDTLPYHLSNEKSLTTMKTLDIDITYYIGSRWEVPSESMIPSNDIPVFDYLSANKMSSKPGTFQTFEYALEKNLTQLIDFCSQLTSFQRKQFFEYKINERRSSYRHYHRHINQQISNNDSFHE
jgi:hypothetical protein